MSGKAQVPQSGPVTPSAQDDSDLTEDDKIALPPPQELRNLVKTILSETRRSQSETRMRKIRENLAKAAVSDSDDDDDPDLCPQPDTDDVAFCALRTVREQSGPKLCMKRVRGPPPGLAWIRLHCNMKVTEHYEHDFHVPYLGESDDRIKSSNSLAKDLIETEDGVEGNDSEFEDYAASCGASEDDFIADTDNHEMDDIMVTGVKLSPAKFRRLQRMKVSIPVWDRAAKRIALKKIVDSLHLSGVDRISDIVQQVFKLRNVKIVDSYYANILTRVKLWKAKDDEAERLKLQNAEILMHARCEMTTSAFDVLKSQSIPYFICRQCYTYCCVMHGTQPPRPPVEPVDKTRKDTNTKQAVDLIEANCEDRQQGDCWCIGEKDDDCVEWVESLQHDIDVWKDVKSVMKELFPVFGQDPCRMSSLVRIVLAKHQERIKFTCMRVGCISEALFKEQLLNTKAPVHRTVRRRKSKSSKGKTRPPPQESDSMKGGKRLDYFPCHHAGPCTKKVCECVQNGVLCEKYCGCNRARALNDKVQVTCNNAFAGCQCRSSVACFSNACACFSQGRECDPDRCRTCLDCKQETDGKDMKLNCKNVGLRMNYRAKTLAGHSDVHGWGVFAALDIPKSEIIGEYVGEVIEQQDAERRGRIYDETKYSFLFNITNNLALDSTRLGNKLRYCNHSNEPNCEPRVMRVDGDVRVGIYAKRDIAKHEELFFDYGYHILNDVPYDWAQPGKKAKPSKKRPNGRKGSAVLDDDDEVLPVSARCRDQEWKETSSKKKSLRNTDDEIEDDSADGSDERDRTKNMAQSEDNTGTEDDDVVEVGAVKKPAVSPKRSPNDGELSVWRGVLKRVSVSGGADVESPRRRVATNKVNERPRGAGSRVRPEKKAIADKRTETIANGDISAINSSGMRPNARGHKSGPRTSSKRKRQSVFSSSSDEDEIGNMKPNGLQSNLTSRAINVIDDDSEESDPPVSRRVQGKRKHSASENNPFGERSLPLDNHSIVRESKRHRHGQAGGLQQKVPQRCSVSPSPERRPVATLIRDGSSARKRPRHAEGSSSKTMKRRVLINGHVSPPRVSRSRRHVSDSEDDEDDGGDSQHRSKRRRGGVSGSGGKVIVISDDESKGSNGSFKSNFHQWLA